MVVFEHICLQVALLSACLCLAFGQTCPAERQSTVKFTINSHRNQTGHWEAQVRLVRGPEGHANSRPWAAEVVQNVASCNGQDSVELEVTLTSPPPRAGPGYELHRGIGYYKLHKEPKKWAEARKICEEEGAHLAVINSKEEEAVFRSIFEPYAKERSLSWLLIGFHDLYTEGQYLTIFDEPLKSTGFVNWCSGQPNNNYSSLNSTHPQENCGSIYKTGCLNDLHCDDKQTFLCEQELW